ncbi:MAG: CHAD domain-containing protein, partial [Stellaceae bacterium]
MDAPTPRLAQAPELTADLGVGDGLQEMLAGALGALSRRANGARYPTAESIHRFRVGLRRLRSILSAFNDAFPERERRALGDRLRAVAQRYGRAREWDVFLDHSVAPLRAAMPEEAALAALERLARKARRAVLPPNDTLKANLAIIEQAVAEAPWLRRPAPGRTEIWAMPLRDYAAGLLDQRHRKLRKR